MRLNFLTIEQIEIEFAQNIIRGRKSHINYSKWTKSPIKSNNFEGKKYPIQFHQLIWGATLLIWESETPFKLS